MASERYLGAAIKHLPSWGIDAFCSATLRLLHRQEAVFCRLRGVERQ